MNVVTKAFRPDRHPADSYEDYLARDSRPVPEHLREGPVPDIGTAPVMAANYTDPAYARAEEKHLWPYVWQMACREEEIPNPGDVHIYDIAGKSLLVTRQKDGSIRAFHNSCLHRARKLATVPGCRKDFRCPYHGIAWHTDGTLKDNPIAWDFPQWEGTDTALPEAKVGLWAGFVFVNMDRDAEPFEQAIQPIQQHFERYDTDDCYIAFHVAKTIACNWKASAEAFMESHHAITTHPQILPFIADVNSQYDILSENVSRQFSAQSVPSPFVGKELTETDIARAMFITSGDGVSGGEGVEVPEGSTARIHVAETIRQALHAEDGHDYGDAADAEMVDALLYNIFPNFSVWAGHLRLVYRWRPNGRDHRSSIMDVYMLKRVPEGGQRPKPAPVFEIGIDESILEEGPKAGMSRGFAAVLEQDMANLPLVQEGMLASETGVLHFGAYSELRIRHMHQTIDRYIARGMERAGGQPG